MIIQIEKIINPKPKFDGKATESSSFFTANPPMKPAPLKIANETPKNSPLRSGK